MFVFVTCTASKVLIYLTQELLKELNEVQTKLRRTTLDYENECEGRRRLQEEVREHKTLLELQAQRPFVVALIDADADCYVVSSPI